MKVTTTQLRELILQEVRNSQNVLLENPMAPREEIRGPEEQVNLVSQKLWAMAREADQMHDVLKGDRELSADNRDSILDMAARLHDIFEAVMYDTDAPEGR